MNVKTHLFSCVQAKCLVVFCAMDIIALPCERGLGSAYSELKKGLEKQGAGKFLRKGLAVKIK
jgi:hypothetical protein